MSIKQQAKQDKAEKKLKTKDTKVGTKSAKKSKISKEDNPKDTELDQEIKRDKNGKLIFQDFTNFKPNLTPKEVMQLGSFGGTYFRPIKSSVTRKSYKDVWQEFPSDWFQGLDIQLQVASPTYTNSVNKYQVKCGGSLQMWEESGWIKKKDPYGWFQWYCRFYCGRRCDDDQHQVQRWLNCAGPKGRWRNNLIAKCVRQGKEWHSEEVSPVVRQTLQHWGYVLNKEDYDKQASDVKIK